MLALFGVFVEVGTRTGVPTPLLAFSLLFASSYFSTITPQGGSQNVIFVGSGYLTQGELYRVGGLTTGVCLLISCSWARHGSFSWPAEKGPEDHLHGLRAIRELATAGRDADDSQGGRAV